MPFDIEKMSHDTGIPSNEIVRCMVRERINFLKLGKKYDPLVIDREIDAQIKKHPQARELYLKLLRESPSGSDLRKHFIPAIARRFYYTIA